ncbi:MAG: META domain-containing protein [Aeromonas sp.]
MSSGGALRQPSAGLVRHGLLVSGLWLVASACLAAAVVPSPPPLAAADFLHRHWRLVAVDGQALPAHWPMDLEVGEQFTLLGHAGCQQFSAQGHWQAGALHVESIELTPVACPNAQHAVTHAVLSTLSAGGRIEGTLSRWTWHGPSHQLTYQLRDWVH